MIQKTKNYIFQYKVLFNLSWICLYLIFPAWINSHIFFTSKFPVSEPFARSLVILAFTIYFSISAFLINRYFNTLTVGKPVIIKINDWSKHIKNNIWLFILCCLSVVLHIYPLSLVFITMGGGETTYLEQVLWIYDSLNSYWHRLFDFPPQYLFWSVIILIILAIKQKRMISFISNYIRDRFSLYESSNLRTLLYISTLFVIFSMYSYLFPFYYSYEQLHLLRYPPVYKFIYLISYYATGFSYTGPRIVQLILYILSAVYIYRTIWLFREKETALLGASIYLFSPLIFSYASRSAIESGAVFFMILISFHFLRFIKEKDIRDLIMTSYLIGIGFLYKQPVLVMFIICFAYLIFSRIKKGDWHSTIHFKILLLSLIFILPFFMIGRREGMDYYAPVVSKLIAIDSLFLVIQSQLSVILSFLLLFSILFVLFKRDHLSLFFGFYFIVYYLFFTLSFHAASQRYSMALYPAIVVLLAQFIFSVTQRFRYKHFFKISFAILTVYLIFLCLVPRTSANLISFKYKDFEGQYFPVDKATDWIKNRTGNNEKILSLYMADYEFYVDRIYADTSGINKDRFIHYKLGASDGSIYPIENLKKYCYAKRISYIMFQFGPNNSASNSKAGKRVSKEVNYLKEHEGNELIEVAKFNHEDNYILIYKLKE